MCRCEALLGDGTRCKQYLSGGVDSLVLILIPILILILILTDHRSPITLNPHPNHLSGSVDSLTESEMKNPNGTSHTCGIGGAVEGGSTCVSKSVIRNLREHCLTTALST